MPPLACPQSSLILCRIRDYYSISAKGMMGSEEEKEEAPHFSSSHFPPRHLQCATSYEIPEQIRTMLNIEPIEHRLPFCHVKHMIMIIIMIMIMIISPSATSTSPSLHVRIWQDGDYHKVLIAPFALILNHSFMLSLVVNSTVVALPRDTTQQLTQSLTSLPSNFNL